MPDILVDTDILIDIANGDAVAIEHLRVVSINSAIAISVPTHMELIVGCRNKTELNQLNQFLGRFQLLHVNTAVSSKALELVATYRLSHGLLIPDAFIAATAIAENLALLSKNQRDYRFIQNLHLLPYPPAT
ncbi:MAG: type II toxin-antitoxin system VapC family toxin [Cyanobacteria bacterium P01_F01_bin.33]